MTGLGEVKMKHERPIGWKREGHHGEKLTVQVQQVLFVTHFGHVSWRYGVRRENRATQAGGSHVIWAQRRLLGLAMWREGLVWSNTKRRPND